MKKGKKPVITDVKSFVGTDHENMINRTIDFCEDPDNVAITDSIAAFSGYIDTLKSNRDTVNALRASIGASFRGAAQANDSLKGSIASAASTVLNATFSYAVDNNLVELAGEMKISISDMIAKKNVNFITFVQGAIDTVTPLVPSLTNYNVTSGQLTSLSALLTTYISAVSNPEDIIAWRKSVNIQIQDTLKGSMDILYNNCDKVATQFRETEVAYYTNYRTSRKLVPHRMSTQLRAHVSNILGPVTVGDVFILGTDRSGTLDNTGYCLVDNIPFGSHQVAVTTPGGTTTTFGPYDFKLGHSLTEYFVVPVQSETKAGENTTAPETPAKTATRDISAN